MSLTVCIIIARKIAKRHSVGEQRTGIYRRDKLLCFKFVNRFEIYRLIQVVSPSETSIVPPGTICFPESEF